MHDDPIGSALGDCLCWNATSDAWCDGQTCERVQMYFVFYALPSLLAAALLALFLVNYGLYACCRGRPVCCNDLCCGEESHKLTQRPSGLLMYRVAVGVTVAIMCVGGLTSSLAVDDASGQYAGIMAQISGGAGGSLADVNDSVAIYRSGLVGALRRIAPVPASARSAATAALDASETVYSWTHDARNVLETVHDVLPWSYGAVWAPVVGACSVLALCLLPCKLPGAVSRAAVLVAVLLALPMLALQVLSSAVSVTLMGACHNYDAVDAFASTYFVAHVGHSPTLLSLSAGLAAVEAAYYDSTCAALRDPIGHATPVVIACSDYFTCPASECVNYADVPHLLATSHLNTSAPNAARDRGTCGAPCSIAQCATSCRVGSPVQAVAANIMGTQRTVARDLTSAQRAEEALRNGTLFSAIVADLHRPLCAEDTKHRVGRISKHLSSVTSVLSVFTFVTVMLASALSLFSEVAAQLRESKTSLLLLENDDTVADNSFTAWQRAKKRESVMWEVQGFTSAVLPKYHSSYSRVSGMTSDGGDTLPALDDLGQSQLLVSDFPAPARTPTNTFVSAAGRRVSTIG